MSDKMIQLNKRAIKQKLGKLVRESIETTRNELPDQEADRLTNAKRYEHSKERADTRAGHYDQSR